MKPRLAVTLLLIVVIPLAALAWLGVRVVRDEQDAVRQRFSDLLTRRLNDVDAVVGKVVDRYERDLSEAAELADYRPETLRQRVRTHPLVRQMFVLDPGLRLVHPPPLGPVSDAEQAFVRRLQHVWEDPQRFTSPRDTDAQSAPTAVATRPNHGWYVWYWREGIHLLFWSRRADGYIVGIEVIRARLKSDIINELPSPDPSGKTPSDGQIALLDANGKAVHRWGRPMPQGSPAAEIAVTAPLNSWKLAYFVPPTRLARHFGGSFRYNFLLGLAAVAIAIVGLAVYLQREHTRAMREARQRVSFVNQVSHELRTPLTNICMYAELLQRDLPEDDPKASHRLGIVVSESQRLSRLIGNVLTWAREQKGQLALHRTAGVVDDHVRLVLESFRPSLAARGIEVELSAEAPAPVQLDHDALDQILGNLFTNVEKYAADGKAMRVTTRQQDETTTVLVTDEGPGIPSSQRERVFEPFYRVDNRITSGVAGTGIGLAIARRLARRHGGDLELVPIERGACFRLTLHTPSAPSGGTP